MNRKAVVRFPRRTWEPGWTLGSGPFIQLALIGKRLTVIKLAGTVSLPGEKALGINLRIPVVRGLCPQR